MKRFFQHSAVYAAGNLLNRGAAFLLLPLYTHYLSPADYGVLTILLVTTFVVRSLLSMGIAHATLRFYFEFEREEDRRRIVSTCLLAVFAFGALGMALLLPCVRFVAPTLLHSTESAWFFNITLGTLLLEMMIEVAQAVIRARERSLLFVAVSFMHLVAKVGFNLYTVVVLRRGVEGVLWGNLGGVALVWLVLTPMTLRYAGLHFDVKQLRAVLRYSLPLVPGILLGMVITSSDRFFLTRYATLAAVGVYGFAFTFGLLMQTALIEPFTLAFGPYRFAIMRRAHAKDAYARILTYLVFALSFAWLGISVFAKDVIGLIASASYLQAWELVPLVCGSVAVSGVSYLLQTGIYLTKRTRRMLVVNLLTCGAVLLFHRLLVPTWGMHGAAIAVVLANLTSVLATYTLAQRVYPVVYEFRRIAGAAVVAIALYVVSLVVAQTDGLFSIALRVAVVASFPVVLGLFGVIRKEEWQALVQLVKKGAPVTEAVSP